MIYNFFYELILNLFNNYLYLNFSMSSRKSKANQPPEQAFSEKDFLELRSESKKST